MAHRIVRLRDIAALVIGYPLLAQRIRTHLKIIFPLPSREGLGGGGKTNTEFSGGISHPYPVPPPSRGRESNFDIGSNQSAHDGYVGALAVIAGYWVRRWVLPNMPHARILDAVLALRNSSAPPRWFLQS